MFLRRRNKICFLWYYHEDGRRIKISTHATTKADAYELIQTFRKSLTPDGKRKKLILEFIDEVYSSILATHAKSAAYLFKRCLKDLKPQTSGFYVATRLKAVTPVSVHTEACTLRAALDIAVRWRVLESNPFAGLPLPRIPVPIPAFFSAQDFEHLIATVKEEWPRDVLTFTVLTGLRKGEVVNLQWPQVDFARKLIIIQSSATFKTKAGKKRSVPLGEMPYELLCR